MGVGEWEDRWREDKDNISIYLETELQSNYEGNNAGILNAIESPHFHLCLYGDRQRY